ncbi:zinc-dependent dehydrogenase [Petroclostridium sp. X23]|uniref:zinc-dependent dehydrogenase n=1 Tax=Petroclostridium sp. X23 TaxID=3045146 RepID=UPI0024AD198A|nr:zinc-dependent dehydrogenase [Petroclostridium sp. X23]WHH57320.1 zinc-dependent dehydrogenase [Petroclostridium sp. X23]
MKAVVLYGANDFKTVEVDKPVINKDEVLLKVKASAICGTDLRILEGKKTKDVRYPSTIGHEMSGVLEEIGADVKEFAVGDRVSIAPVIPCHGCYYCLSGRENACQNRVAIGYQFDGGFAEYVRIPAIAIKYGHVVKLADHVSFEEGALAEPLSCCINGIKKAGITLNDRVLIVGAGPIGLMHLQLAKSAGASKIIVSEPIDSRRAMAKKFGADIIVNPATEDLKDIVMQHTDGYGVDKIIMAIGVPAIVNDTLKLARKGGTINLFAGFAGTGECTIEANVIHYNEINVNGTTAFTRLDYLSAVSLIAAGKVNVKDLVSHVYKIDDFTKAYETCKSGEGVKVLIEP